MATPVELHELGNRLMALAVALTGSLATAEDLVQDAIVRVYPRLPSIDSAGAHAYMRTTIVNLHRDRYRSLKRDGLARRQLETAEFDDDAGPSAGLRIDIHRALTSVTPEVRIVVILRFLEDLSVAAVATLLHRPEGSIRRMTHQGIEALRRSGLLDDYFNEKREAHHVEQPPSGRPGTKPV